MKAASLFAGAVLATPFSALAQPDQPSSDSDDQTIVVTATHRSEPLSRLPLSVAIIDGEQLASARPDHAEDLAGLLPGVEVAVANGSQPVFQIRGIGAVDHQALTPGAAAVYSDGVYLATNVQTGALLYDLERVEVLKGPQGSLYGRNASSGAIHLISRGPARSAGNHVEAGYGNYGRVEIAGAVEGTVADGVRVRAASRYLSRGPVLDNVAGPKKAAGEDEEFGLRLTTLIEREGASLTLRGHYEKNTGINPTPRNSALAIGKHEVATEGDGQQDTDNSFYGVSASLEASIGPWDLFSLTAFEGYRQNYGFDFDGTPAPFGNPSLNANLAYRRKFAQLSQELRLQQSWESGNVLFGANVTKDDFTQRYTIWCGTLDPVTLVGSCNYVGAPGRVGPTPASIARASTLVTDIEQDRTALAAFGYGEIGLAPGLSLSVGARLTRETIEGQGQGIHVFADGVRDFNNRGGIGPAIGRNTVRTTRLTGNASLGYDSGDGLLYAAIANGYKSGGFNGEIANNASHYADEGLFAAEDVTAIELGYKHDRSGSLSYSAAAFYQFYRRPQARIFVEFSLPDGSRIVSNSLSNLDSARSYGAEVQASWKAGRGLVFDMGAVWNQTRIRQKSNIGGNAELFDGNPLPFAPRLAVTLAGRYETALTQALTLRLGGQGKFRSRHYLDPEGLTERSQAAVLTLASNASLVFPDRGLEIGVWVRNLTNVDYAQSGYGFLGYNTFRSEPRTVGVVLSKSF